MEFNVETLKEVQAYAYFAFTGLLCVILYSYIYHLYSSDKKGKTNYESYSNIALDDDIDSTPIKKDIKTDKTKIGAN
ncbi:cytochrome c oxidase, cbb3-type, CcoQ subunit [Arcobacter sp. 31_11_sub10_T18]|nr:cytochrome c oxidase, cbb3-type, CcoQ subunit [Arcobacter sp. 31_11_sub10_T18]